LTRRSAKAKLTNASSWPTIARTASTHGMAWADARDRLAVDRDAQADLRDRRDKGATGAA
jgi:hypothetical protein